MRKGARLGAVLALLALSSACARKESGPPELDPEQIQLGRAVYNRECASCHGGNAEGMPAWTERNAAGEFPASPHNQDGHTWRHADGMLYRIVRDGWRDPTNRTDRLTMPGFGNRLSPGEVRAVITYLKTLWTPEQRTFQWEESRKEPFPPDDAP